MNTQTQDTWKRRGMTLLWDPHLLASVGAVGEVWSIHQFFHLGDAWPETLPSQQGDAVVVAGLEGCLDALSTEDAQAWLESDLRSRILEFQEHYQGQAALILWVPSGRSRISMALASEEYSWKPVMGGSQSSIPIGRCLFGGAESDVERLLNREVKDTNPDGLAYAGLYHPRIS